MRKRIVAIFTVLAYCVGIFLLCYPTIANMYNNVGYTTTITSYQTSADSLSVEEKEALIEGAREYNEGLPYSAGATTLPKNKEEQYYSTLSYNGSDVMGILTIPAINVKLPIYHGVDAGILQSGVGHIPGSSLPIGGKGTHCALSAHSGMANQVMFDHLDDLKEGDQFIITVLGEDLVYTVDNIQVVEPEDSSELFIDEDKDYCSLITCTPYGINSHRLVVRGVRDGGEITATEHETVSGNYENVGHTPTSQIVTVAVCLGSIPLFAMFIVLLFRKKRKAPEHIKKGKK